MKIDITKLEGFRPEMTSDERLALLEKAELPDADYTGYVKKDALDKAAKEAADYKKQLQSKLTEDEQKEAALKAEREAEKAELETLRKEAAVSRYKSKFLASGYDEKLATDAAKAMADGDTEKFFAYQTQHIENVRKSERAAVLAGNAEPPAGQNTPIKKRDALIEKYNEAEKKGDVNAMVQLDAQIRALPKE